MTEMQLEEEQDIYETVRAGITEGGSSFEMARHVLDALSDSGYIIIRADLVEPVILGDAVTREDTGRTGTTDATFSASAVTTSPTSLEPVTDDDLREAVEFCKDICEQARKVGEAAGEDYDGSCFLKHVETLINHTMKGQKG